MTVGAAVSVVGEGGSCNMTWSYHGDRTQVGLEPGLGNNPQSFLPSDSPPPVYILPQWLHNLSQTAPLAGPSIQTHSEPVGPSIKT